VGVILTRWCSATDAARVVTGLGPTSERCMSNLSPADVLDILDLKPTAEKRASWELFSFVVFESVRVEVINKFYSASEEHN
jgi:hypothetical protein